MQMFLRKTIELCQLRKLLCQDLNQPRRKNLLYSLRAITKIPHPTLSTTNSKGVKSISEEVKNNKIPEKKATKTLVQGGRPTRSSKPINQTRYKNN